MKTAILLSDGKLGTFEMEKMKIVTFVTEKERVVGVEDEPLVNSTPNYLLLWCLQKNIDQLYISKISQDKLLRFEAIDVTVKVEKELRRDNLYLTFVS